MGLIIYMKRESKENIKKATVYFRKIYEEMPQRNESKADTC